MIRMRPTMLVSDWMTTPVHTVDAGTPLATCAERMRTLGIRHLPVVDASGVCVAVLTDAGFAQRGAFVAGTWVPYDEADTKLVARKVAVTPEVTATPDDPLRDVLERLLAAFQDCVLVLDPAGAPIGIFTEHDVVAHARELLPDGDVSEVARRDLPLLEASMDALDARSWMARKRHRHALVVDGGVLTGVLSHRDVALEDAIQDATLRDIASRPVARTEPIAAREVARILHAHKYGCLPLVDEHGRPVGIVTRVEILQAVIAALGE
ncbi:MAG: CBS domain-containing protein [Alphaproteobacteria bacterium]|nr:CBS domain-containing protein [Alphaproteobacteria bacterium]MCB9692648.1 CBS domain-containing protein [Alphaproteobacteria bacterium]